MTTTRRKFTLERTLKAPLADVWELWTTKEGLESWWGPDGFRTEVRKLDLRPGGEWRYAMTATAPAQVEFMKKAGMPLTTESHATYSEVEAQRRLGYMQVVDFVPEVKPYDVATSVELQPVRGGVRMLINVDGMHDELWTDRARMGWESQLGRLESTLTRGGR
ncbi:MAG: SRPBCC family protein [Myxococcales bacterium]